MTREVVFTPESEWQLQQLYSWIASGGSPETAARYVEAVVSTCESLSTFPNRGVARDDIRAGLRVTHHRGRTAIAFTIFAERVEILGIFHGGRDYATVLREDED